MSIYELPITKLSDLSNIEFPDYWVFRGQDSNWPLKTGIERSNTDLSIENKFDEIFKSRITSFINEAIYGKLEVRALMQHYGMKTRLLDFTKSFLVALYFATEGKLEEDGVVWAVNLLELYVLHVQQGRLKPPVLSKLRHIEADYRKENTTALGLLSPMLIPVDLHDKHLTRNQRFINQKGKFLTFTLNSFETSFYRSFDVKKNERTKISIQDLRIELKTKVIKFLISKEIKAAFQELLKSKGITKAYLFPDEVDSFAPEFERICKTMCSQLENKEFDEKSKI